MYDLPPNDPRYLDMTAPEMAYDLLLAVYRATHSAPGTERLAADAEQSASLAEELEESGKTFLADEGTQRGLRALLGGGRKEERRTPVRVRLRGTVTRESDV